MYIKIHVKTIYINFFLNLHFKYLSKSLVRTSKIGKTSLFSFFIYLFFFIFNILKWDLTEKSNKNDAIFRWKCFLRIRNHVKTSRRELKNWSRGAASCISRYLSESVAKQLNRTSPPFLTTKIRSNNSIPYRRVFKSSWFPFFL